MRSIEEIATVLNEVFLSYEELTLLPTGNVRFRMEDMTYSTAKAIQEIKKNLDADRVLIYAENSSLVFEVKWIDK